ncbi:MAG: hypothetical protein KBD46_03540, partial [Candidatus Levybacteria bacterium]|nr:hypothetical protein [Candidatus Levybacteria bacterium]
MKKITIILSIVLIIGVFGYMRFFSNEPMVSPLSSLSHPTGVAATITPVQQQTMTSIFVPYWSFTTKKIDTKDLDIIIYFGISADENGIDKTDAGYTKLSQFNKLLPAQTETLLTVRMIDSEFNSKLLEDKKLQEKIILESIALAKEHNFSGIVLDFEINALAFDSVIKNISSLYIRYSKEVKANNLTFSVTLYGDTFYRARPYDVEEIVKHADHIY